MGYRTQNGTLIQAWEYVGLGGEFDERDGRYGVVRFEGAELTTHHYCLTAAALNAREP